MQPYLRKMIYGLLGGTTLTVAYMFTRPAPPVPTAVEAKAAVMPLRQEQSTSCSSCLRWGGRTSRYWRTTRA